jgi:hypothetical protein
MLESLLDPKARNVAEECEAKVLYEKFKAKALELDEEGSGLVGVTYTAILDALVTGQPLETCFKDYKKKSLNFCVAKLRESLSEVYQEFSA